MSDTKNHSDRPADPPSNASRYDHMGHFDGHPETIAAHWAENGLDHKGGASPPIYQSSTFLYPDMAAFEKRNTPESPYDDYTRVSNPTTRILEAKIAKLESGTWARAFGSGMGAIVTAISACLRAGDHVVCIDHSYGPTRTFLNGYLKRFGVETTFIPGAAAQPFLNAIRPNTRLMYLESPTTGHFEMLDLDGILAGIRTHHASDGPIVTIFDNSWSTPIFQRPLERGIDMVLHSATKYIGGHSDVVAGMLAGRDPDLGRRIAKEAELLGATLDPFAAWLLIRGLRTLPIRMRQHEKTGLALARFLADHPKVLSVNHPGLKNNPGHAIAPQYLDGYAGLFSFKLKDQSREATNRFIDHLRLFSIGVSWGGYESLAIGGSFFSTDLQNPEWLIRLHCGLEATEDLLNDVRQALD